MGLIHILYKGGSLPAATSTQSKQFKQLTQENVKFLLQIGLKPKIEYGHFRYWG
jgi:hypothetical protein